jgi:hypothetical protein
MANRWQLRLKCWQPSPVAQVMSESSVAPGAWQSISFPVHGKELAGLGYLPQTDWLKLAEHISRTAV